MSQIIKDPSNSSNQQCPSEESSRPNSFILFCSTISIRGINKVNRGPQTLRVLWLSFIVIMSCVLITASCLLVRDFMLYDVNINTQVRLDSRTQFPSLSICHHHPFSDMAYQLWSQRKILSPTHFNKIIRQLTLEQLQNDSPDAAELISYFDGISMYYQNLSYSHAVKIGHGFDIFLSCMYLHDNMIIFEDDCTKLENYSIRLYSHHEHFNCYTFEPTHPNISESIKMLGVIVSLGPQADYLKHEQAFIIDTFRQAKGLKVLVHEPHTMPDIDNEGLHVEPGKMNEISYRPVQWELTNTPAKPCVNRPDKFYPDLLNNFSYTKSFCLKHAQQLKIMDACKCMFIFNPRPQLPSDNMPYCGSILRNFNLSSVSDKLSCLAEVMQNKDYMRSLEKKKCFKRCLYYTYETSISVTKWRATDWHMHWLRIQLKSLQALVKFKNDNPRKDIKSSPYFKMWMSYANQDNLSHISPTFKERIMEGTNFAYIVLRRESDDSVMKYERLVITPYVLISRIGGLCSLTVGITLAFVVELLEFLYLYLHRRPSSPAYSHSNVIIKNIGAADTHVLNHLLQDNSPGIQVEENPWRKQPNHNSVTFQAPHVVNNSECLL